MLFSPANHEPLTDEAWDETRVRAATKAIVDDALAALDPVALWPSVEGWDVSEGQAVLPLTTLYTGACGVVWALDVLRGRGYADVEVDLAGVARHALETWRRSQASTERPPWNTRPSLFSGESGLLLVAYKLAADSEIADRLHELVCANWDSSLNELMSGSPGTMLAAKAMLDWSGDGRWAAAWRTSAEELWRRRHDDGYWTCGTSGKLLGAAHGIGTNTNVLLQGGDLLADDRRERLPAETAAALERCAVVEGGLANWPISVEHGRELAVDGQIRLQWCHGGAGVVSSAAAYLDEELLRNGAELVWQAGPKSMEKGQGLCHGTAGNGYALLRTFGRTRDELWLDRAKQFAVHALGQVERWRAQRGTGRYSLWSGDVGVALFAADCLERNAAMPIVDYL
jgi:hypothetical protein